MTGSHRLPSLRRSLATLAVASALGTGTVQATPDTRITAEIDQLLANIANSNCSFIRSGQEYTAAEARKHLEMKMNFVLSGIESTEQFIDKLASVSSTTGEPYQIRCGSTQTVARTWLNTQLKLVRNQH